MDHASFFSEATLIEIGVYLICSLCTCKGILSHKDLHPPPEISSERQDISQKKKTYNVTSYASHQLAHLSSSP